MNRIILKLSRSIIRCQNMINPIIYNMFQGNKKKHIVLEHNRESYKGLLKYLIGAVIRKRYSWKKKFFIYSRPFQRGIAGKKGDLFELSARSFLGTCFLSLDSADEDIINVYVDVIKKGTSKDSKYYWGKIKHDMVVVENTSIIIGLLINRSILWPRFNENEKNNIRRYIEDSLKRKFPVNNWLWFKLFHYVFLSMFYSLNYESHIAEVLSSISSIYDGQGWYDDGGRIPNERHYDHYNSWAMHYYGLMFLLLYQKGDLSNTSDEILKRCQEFIESYLLFFSNEGFVPVGRSLIYRFASLSVFALAIKFNLLNYQQVNQVKLISREIVNKFTKNGMIDNDGMLTMGFYHSNKLILEEYSGDGSPYWALKFFSFLLLDKNNDYWQPPSEQGNIAYDRKMLDIGIFVSSYNGHSILINGSLNSTTQSLKYNKFSFSNIFLPSLSNKAIDNSLVIYNRFIKNIIYKFKVTKDQSIHVHWGISQIKNYEVFSTIIPIIDGYVLISVFKSYKKIPFSYYGFNFPGDYEVIKSTDSMCVFNYKYYSKIGVHGVNLNPDQMGFVKLRKKFNYGPFDSVIPFYRGTIPSGYSKQFLVIEASEKSKMNSEQKNIMADDHAIVGSSWFAYNATDNYYYMC